MLSFQGGIRVPSYTASKSGLAGLTKAAGLRVGVEGHQRQRHRARLFRRPTTPRPCAPTRPQRDILARIPAGRWGQPSDLGGAAVFLASHAADYVHGTVLAVDGGWLAR
jgi:2-deoxy-D-gluconate 3-dehydrogenase